MSKFALRMANLNGFILILLKICSAGLYRGFVRSARRPKLAQDRALHKILKLAAKTERGRTLGIHPRLSYREFTQRVPIVAYEALAAGIAKQRETGEAIIAAGKVKTFEPTSGSSAKEKWIPYNTALLRAFQRYFLLWMHNILRFGPKLESGRIFISISAPSFARQHSGLKDDSEYLSGFLAKISKSFLVLPPELAEAKNSEEFYQMLGDALLREADLEVISVWSPTYLISLLESMEKKGKFEGQKVWPKLKLVSCWLDAEAARYESKIKSYFPGVRIQGKGLLATEAPISLPLAQENLCVPLLDEVFFEFLSPDGSSILRLDELVQGNHYELILSQSSGLLRYKLGDLVQIDGSFQNCPTFKFIGRVSGISDMVGEKLNQVFVEKILESYSPFSLVPVSGSSCFKPFYALILFKNREHATLGGLETEIERLFSQSYHYALARKLGQLDPVVLFPFADADRRILALLESSGMKRGDIKPRSFFTKSVEAESFFKFFSEPAHSPPAKRLQ